MYNPVRLGLYTQATGAGDHIGLPGDRRFSPLLPSYRSTLADLLGLRYIAAGAPLEEIDKSLWPGDFPLIARTPDAYVYENPRALPRVLFCERGGTRRLRPAAPRGKLAARRARAHRPPGRRPARSGGAPAGRRASSPSRNTEVVLEADSPAGGWVVLNDVWQPWWRAEIDGAPVPLLRANVLFRAAEVPAGRHEVRFVFRPFSSVVQAVLEAATGRAGAR